VSATGRSNDSTYVRHPTDFFPTPDWAIAPVATAIMGSVLDPCAGNGSILRYFRDLGHHVYGFDINPNVIDVACDDIPIGIRDALGPEPWIIPGRPHWHQYSSIVTNPPYKLAAEFVERANSERTRVGCDVWMLLRLGFLGSRSRRELHERYPADVYVLEKRPSFGLNKRGKRGTDACEYAWFHWGDHTGGRYTILQIDIPKVKK